MTKPTSNLLSSKNLLGFTAVICLTSCLLLTGCINVYKKDITQGNHVTQEMVDKLKVDMTKSQVQQVMGTPALVPVFKLSRWDYYYFHKPGDGSPIEEKTFSLYFVKDKLKYYDGEWAPASIPRKTK